MKFYHSLLLIAVTFCGCKKITVENKEPDSSSVSPSGKLLKAISYESANVSYVVYDSVIYDYDKTGKLINYTEYRKDNYYTNNLLIIRKQAAITYNPNGLPESLTSRDKQEGRKVEYKFKYTKDNLFESYTQTDSAKNVNSQFTAKIIRKKDSLLVEQNGFLSRIYKKLNNNLVYQKTIVDDSYLEIKDHDPKLLSPFYSLPKNIQEILFLTGFQSYGIGGAYDPFVRDKLSKNVPGSFRTLYESSVKPAFEYSSDKNSFVLSVYAGSENKRTYVKQLFYYD